MTIFEWALIGTIAGGIFSLIVALYSLVGFGIKKRQLSNLSIKQTKSKRKRKALERAQLSLKKGKKSKLIAFSCFFLLAIALISGGAYISYYQSMNLSKNDAESVSKSYFLLRDFESQLVLAKDQGDEEEKLKKNIRYLATGMASYGVQKASPLNTKEGQTTLNRYYTSLSQLGMNASTQINKFYGNEALVDDFLADIKRAKTYEKGAFQYYKVNEALLEEND
ncbi:hypothetical protein I6N95_03345 [Vagococcus sp. BWB3-3]|uniref:Uncharacterized protein n=1 Tax=Vagococcus allomyrinae TaxID=2794353 RepID=A0A940PAU7_9ENTE|nr:hypothetical protein [Vagococcus allomyrinae]MBP1040041.1 hypothetical protein [Vagococcus allomyrinae]